MGVVLCFGEGMTNDGPMILAIIVVIETHFIVSMVANIDCHLEPMRFALEME